MCEAVGVLLGQEVLPEEHVDRECQVEDNPGDDVDREQVETAGSEAGREDLDPGHQRQENNGKDLDGEIDRSKPHFIIIFKDLNPNFSNNPNLKKLLPED